MWQINGKLVPDLGQGVSGIGGARLADKQWIADRGGGPRPNH